MSDATLDIWTSDPFPAGFTYERPIEAYGVRIAIGASDPELFELALSALPPLAGACDHGAITARFGLVRDGATVRVEATDAGIMVSPDAEIAVGLLDTLIRTYIARKAPARVFVHAGVVAHEGRALVLPGRSMSGKTTLVAALVRAGARYYSEEYAVLDADGLVHPYPKPLSIRGAGDDVPVERIGGRAGAEPLRAGLVVLTNYLPGAAWVPSTPSPATGVLAVLAHALVARERPAESLAAVTRLVAEAQMLEGDRGEAAELAPTLLAHLSSTPADPPRPRPQFRR